MPRAANGEPLAFFESAMLLDTDEHIIWPYSKTGHAAKYGNLRIGTEMHKVHVLACTLRHGPRPPGQQARHLCRFKLCFNPRHLIWGTPQENQRDRIADDTHVRGARQPHAKLTPAMVDEIRRLTTESVQQKEIARRLGVSRALIYAVQHRQAWGWYD